MKSVIYVLHEGLLIDEYESLNCIQSRYVEILLEPVITLNCVQQSAGPCFRAPISVCVIPSTISSSGSGTVSALIGFGHDRSRRRQAGFNALA